MRFVAQLPRSNGLVSTPLGLFEQPATRVFQLLVRFGKL